MKGESAWGCWNHCEGFIFLVFSIRALHWTSNASSLISAPPSWGDTPHASLYPCKLCTVTWMGLLHGHSQSPVPRIWQNGDYTTCCSRSGNRQGFRQGQHSQAPASFHTPGIHWVTTSSASAVTWMTQNFIGVFGCNDNLIMYFSIVLPCTAQQISGSKRNM